MNRVITIFLLTQVLLSKSQNLLSGLQACYPLDANAANSTTTGATLNGTLINVTSVAGHNNLANTAYKLNGSTGSHIVLPDHPALKSNNMFFSGWFYIDSLPNEQYLVYTKNSCTFNFEAYSLITYHDPSLGHQIFRVSKANNMCQYAPQVQSTTTPLVGNWYHIGFFVSQTSMKIYVNGILEGATTHSILFNYSAGKKVFLGVTNENNFNLPFKGRIDDVRFYDRELTASEVAMLYSTGGSCAGPPGSAPTASFSLSKKQLCKGQNAVLTDLSTNNPSSWAWQIPGGNPASSTIANPTISFSTPGLYSVTLVASNAFGSSTAYSQTLMVSECTGLADSDNSADGLRIYPNPSTGIFYLESTGNPKATGVFDVSGKAVDFKAMFCEQGLKIDMGEVPPGFYLVEVKSDSNATRYLKTMITR